MEYSRHRGQSNEEKTNLLLKKFPPSAVCKHEQVKQLHVRFQYLPRRNKSSSEGQCEVLGVDLKFRAGDPGKMSHPAVNCISNVKTASKAVTCKGNVLHTAPSP